MRRVLVLFLAAVLALVPPGPLGPAASGSATHSGNDQSASSASGAAMPEAPEPASSDTPGGTEARTAKHELSIEVRALRTSVDAIIGSYGWSGATWGVLAISLDADDTLLAVNPTEPLVPASNVKLITTAAALHYLGPEYRFLTFVIAAGSIVDGVLKGDLILYGTGDPTLSDRFHSSKTEVFELLTDQLVDNGIRRIEGGVVGDGTMFSGPSRPASWSRYDPNDAYVAPISALCSTKTS